MGKKRGVGAEFISAPTPLSKEGEGKLHHHFGDKNEGCLRCNHGDGEGIFGYCPGTVHRPNP